MDSGNPIGLREPPHEPFADRLDRQRQVADRAIVWLHAQADRLDIVPPEFGADQAVDPSDGTAVRREWLRQLSRWMDNNPEQMLAIKAGGGALALALLVLVIFIHSMS